MAADDLDARGIALAWPQLGPLSRATLAKSLAKIKGEDTATVFSSSAFA
jgi:hypothetical protein